MCNPMVAVAGGSALMNIMGQQQQQKAQIAYQQAEANARNTQIVQNRSMATAAYIQQMTAENTMKAQETQANAEQAKDLDIQRMKAEGTAKVAAADAGVGGRSLDGMLDDFNRQEAMMLGRIDLNQQFADQARVSRETGYAGAFKQRVQQIQPFMPSPVANVDYLSPILGIGKAAIGAGVANGAFNTPKVGSTGTGSDDLSAYYDDTKSSSPFDLSISKRSSASDIFG